MLFPSSHFFSAAIHHILVTSEGAQLFGPPLHWKQYRSEFSFIIQFCENALFSAFSFYDNAPAETEQQCCWVVMT